jgi:hypothetical protein
VPSGRLRANVGCDVLRNRHERPQAAGRRPARLGHRRVPVRGLEHAALTVRSRATGQSCSQSTQRVPSHRRCQVRSCRTLVPVRAPPWDRARAPRVVACQPASGGTIDGFRLGAIEKCGGGLGRSALRMYPCVRRSPGSSRPCDQHSEANGCPHSCGQLTCRGVEHPYCPHARSSLWAAVC